MWFKSTPHLVISKVLFWIFGFRVQDRGHGVVEGEEWALVRKGWGFGGSVEFGV